MRLNVAGTGGTGHSANSSRKSRHGLALVVGKLLLNLLASAADPHFAGLTEMSKIAANSS